MAGSFSYDSSLGTDMDFLRMMIGDVNTLYRYFYDEELDEILDRSQNNIEKARGECFTILANDPDRLMLTKDGTAGAFTLLSLMRLYARRANQWFASAGD